MRPCRRIRGALLLLGLHAATAGIAAAEDILSPPEDERPYWRRNLFRRVIADQPYLVKTWWPTESRDPLFAGPLVFSLAAAISADGSGGGIDGSTESGVAGSLRARAAGPASWVSRLGDTEVAAAGVGLTYLVGRLTHDARLSETSSLVAEALVNVAIWDTVLKVATSRARPVEGSGSGLFNPEVPFGEGDSFPSGHAMGSFAVAAVVSAQYRDRKWVPWVAYGTASLIGGSRVVLGRHYASDVLVGAVLGVSIGRMVVARSHAVEPQRVQWSPTFDPVGQGPAIKLTYRW